MEEEMSNRRVSNRTRKVATKMAAALTSNDNRTQAAIARLEALENDNGAIEVVDLNDDEEATLDEDDDLGYLQKKQHKGSKRKSGVFTVACTDLLESSCWTSEFVFSSVFLLGVWLHCSAPRFLCCKDDSSLDASKLSRTLRTSAGPPVAFSSLFRVDRNKNAREVATTNVSTDVASMMLDGTVKIPKQLFGNGGASAMPVHELVQPSRGVVEEDKNFLEKKEKMHDLEQQINNASQQDTLHEYFGMMMAVQDAFAEAASSKVFGVDKSRIPEILRTQKLLPSHYH
ncbi:unnamed protein product [Arabidopsis thaliana]|uniref:(thale cress) hypothetical protein n=1 Tax=Arabidopsis thaliana TaxID=3702 RepID=A0A7G2FGG9_ARATH|nr:unnamed protein product [Arabidopsis thaliana]